jgi:hypothetical protein
MGKSRERAAGREERRKKQWTGMPPDMRASSCSLALSAGLLFSPSRSVAILSESTSPATAACIAYILHEQIVFKR